MGQGARTAITVSVLGLLLVVAAVWGWAAFTDPLPAKVGTPICVDREVAAGEKVFASQVTVSVYNAGTREGLAGRVTKELTDTGLHEGNSGNAAPTVRVSVAEIWTRDPKSPAVRLVASRLDGQARVVRRDPVGSGVTVVVGDQFGEVVGGRKAVVAKADAVICSPPAS